MYQRGDQRHQRLKCARIGLLYFNGDRRVRWYSFRLQRNGWGGSYLRLIEFFAEFFNTSEARSKVPVPLQHLASFGSCRLMLTDNAEDRFAN